MDDRELVSGRTIASLALGVVLLAADQLRAVLEAAHDQLQAPAEEAEERGAAAPATKTDDRRGTLLYPLIGAVFDAQRQAVDAGLSGIRRGRGWLRGVERTARWVWMAPPLGDLRDRIEAETARLARIGAAEEARARRLATAATAAAMDRVTKIVLDQEFEGAYQLAIARVLETPEIAELVREQSAGLAQEVAGSVRARAATGDEMIERLVARVLRRSRPGGVAAPAPRPSAGGAEA